MNKIIQGDALEELKKLDAKSVQMCVTSPPYWGLRDYGVEEQLGLEDTPEEYVENLVAVMKEVRRVLKKDGTLWLNLGDCYANTKIGNTETRKNPNVVTDTFRKKIPSSLKPKDLVGIPWRVALALQADGWYLRQDIIWAKPNPMPESVTDRCTKNHEYIFLLAKNEKYYYDNDAIREPQKESSLRRLETGWHGDNKRGWPGSDHNNMDRYMGKTKEEIESLPGRNKRSVWTVTTKPFKDAHFAVFPQELIEPCIKAGSAKGDTVLDPFFGSGTTGVVAQYHNREYIGIELNPEYVKMAEKRIGQNLGI